MNPTRKTSALAGVFYLTGIVFGLLSISGTVDSSEYLTNSALHKDQVFSSALFQFLMTLANAGFAIAMYMLLRDLSHGLALGFISLRLMAALLNIIGFICLLLVVPVSQHFINAGTADASIYAAFGDLLRSLRDIVNHVAMILTNSTGSLLMYVALFQLKLVPRWISAWGFIGTLLTITASVLVMFHFLEIITPVYIALNLPLIGLEMILSIYLIIFGIRQVLKN